MIEKGAQPDLPDLVVLPPAPDLECLWRIGTAQASIIVGPGRWGGQHWDHPSSVFGLQQRGMRHSGVTLWCVGVQPPLVGHTYQGEGIMSKARYSRDAIRALNTNVSVTSVTDVLT